MRFLLRLLLLLALGSFLLRHYGSFIRETLWRVQTANNTALLSRPAGISGDDSQVRPAQADLPRGVLPRHELTPGAIDPRVTQRNIRNTICRRGYTASVRPPFEYTNTMKHRLMRVYGVRGSMHDYELDHLIPLELGGCPDCEANLWPQPRNVFPGAAEKDEVEDYLHHQVCSGVLPLAEAQREIASDWYAVYKRIHSQTQGGGNESNSEVVHVSSKAGSCDQRDRSCTIGWGTNRTGTADCEFTFGSYARSAPALAG